MHLKMLREQGKDHLCIVPHGPLHFLPYHLLELEGKPLADVSDRDLLAKRRTAFCRLPVIWEVDRRPESTAETRWQCSVSVSALRIDWPGANRPNR